MVGVSIVQATPSDPRTQKHRNTRHTFQVSVNDSILVEEHNAVGDLPSIVADNILPKIPKIVKQLVQASTCIHIT